MRGKRIAHIRVAYLGDGGDELVAPLRTGAVMDTLKTMPFTDSGSIAAEPPNPHPYHGTNATVSELNDEMIDAILTHAADSVLILDLLGGALARPPALPGVGWDRSAAFTVRALSMVTDGVEAVRQAHQKLFDALAPWSTGRLLSFVYGESDPHSQADAVYLAEDRQRLARLKAAHDPKSMFRLTHVVSE